VHAARRRRSDRHRRDVGIGGANTGGHRRQQHRQGAPEEGHPHPSSPLSQAQGPPLPLLISRRQIPTAPGRAAGSSYGIPCLRSQVIRAYAFNQLWISGFLMDMCGAALMFTALSQAPVSCLSPFPCILCSPGPINDWPAGGVAGLRGAAHCRMRPGDTLRVLSLLPEGGHERSRLGRHHAGWSRHNR
jgi:hypothetical protein